MINASLRLPTLSFREQGDVNRPFISNDELCLQSFKNIWITETDRKSQFRFTNDYVALGNAAGFNAWAHSQGYPSRPFKQHGHFIKPFYMGRHSLCCFGWFIVTGMSAWFVSRLINLLSVPGLERNLRIIIDWFLALAFRNDIAILAHASSAHLQKSHFKEGDEIFRQGDAGKMAYAVDSGRLKVIQEGRTVRELGPGDYFGEIMPLHQNLRIETVRCITDCELKIIAQEDLKALIKSGWLMGKAIRSLTDLSVKPKNDDLGIKRLTYVSKLNVALDDEQILEIGRLASANNRAIDVTGILISVRDYFFQILEGEEAIVDALLEKIKRDPRHNELTILSVETGCEECLFSDWNMKTVTLNESNDLILLAIGMMLQNIAQSYNAVGRYTQPVLLKFLMDGVNPLTIPIKNTDRIVIAGCITDFANLEKQFSLEELINALNRYLEISSTSIIENGGQVAKYSGNSMIAHFAPDQINAAIAACVDATAKLKALVDSYPVFGAMTYGFGLALGPMIEGNIGSSIKMDYTVLGSTVDQAVSLGILARDLDKAVVVNESIRSIAVPSWRFEHSGNINETENIQVYALTDM